MVKWNGLEAVVEKGLMQNTDATFPVDILRT